MFLSETICDCARPLVSRMPLGAIRLLTVLGGGRQDDQRWRKAVKRYRVFYDNDLGAHISVDLADWGGRWHYYPSKYYDSLNPSLIAKVLRLGDSFVDIGANVGIHTLKASSQVGESGAVVAIEPNPETFKTLQLHTMLNRRTNITLKNCGAADASSVMTIYGDATHSGTYSLVDHGHGSHRLAVHIERTENLVSNDLLERRRILVKIDVEGYELRVLRGMPRILEQPNVIVSLEVTPQWMAMLGDTVGDLEALIEKYNYTVLRPKWKSSLFCGQYEYIPGQIDKARQTDIVLVSQTSRSFLD